MVMSAVPGMYRNSPTVLLKTAVLMAITLMLLPLTRTLNRIDTNIGVYYNDER